MRSLGGEENFKLTEWFTFLYEADTFGLTNKNPKTYIGGGDFGAVTSTLPRHRGILMP